MTHSDLLAFVKRLKAHDWYYAFSDDHSVWTRGERERNTLRGIAKSDPLAKLAFAIVSARYGLDSNDNADAEMEAALTALLAKAEAA